MDETLQPSDPPAPDARENAPATPLSELLPRDLLESFQQELRELARFHLARERAGHTLQPTALVNELWLRLAGQEHVRFESRAALLAFASKAFRSILVDHARRRGAAIRGGGWRRVALQDGVRDLRAWHGGSADAWAHRLLELDDALALLAQTNERSAAVFEMRFFGGMSCEHIGLLLGVTDRTVRTDFAAACGWLSRQLDG